METLFNQIAYQIETVLTQLGRPPVQRQLLAIGLIVLVSWLLSRIFRRLLRDRNERSQLSARIGERAERLRGRLKLASIEGLPQRRAARSLRQLEKAVFPLLALVLAWAGQIIFARQGWAAGFLALASALFTLLLIYRLIVALMAALLSETAARRYDRLLVRPVLVALVILRIGRDLALAFTLSDIQLPPILGASITLSALLRALVLLYLFWAFSQLLEDFLRAVVLPRTSADVGVRNTIVTLTSYSIILFGILVAMAAMGVDLSSLALIGGGLSVGLGFGLQKLVANFMSGMILLFDQSIRPGDVIEVDGQIGVVEKLSIRATTVRTYDNVEIVVPNETLLTNSVTSHTQSDRLERIRLPVGTSYSSDPKEVRDALLAVARRHGVVLKSPPPVVFFNGFGDSSIDFELAVWVKDPTRIPMVRSDLYFMIWDELADRKIEIPFPQRDLHLRSGFPPLADKAPDQQHEPEQPGPAAGLS